LKDQHHPDTRIHLPTSYVKDHVMDSNDHPIGYHEQFQRLGYRTVPIIPGNLVPGDGIVVPHGAGKAPGIKLPDGRWVHLKNWQRLDPRDLHAPLSVEQARAYDKMGAGTGILCGVQGLLGIDVDLILPEAATFVRSWAFECFQKAVPIRSVEDATHIKYTMCVRIVNDEGQPVSVASVGDIGVVMPGEPETNTGGQPKQRMVQIIGARRQFVAFGIHPGRQQRFIWDVPITKTGAPNITTQQIARFFHELPERLTAIGGVVSTSRSVAYRNDPGQELYDAIMHELLEREEKIIQVVGWEGLASDLLEKLEYDFLHEPALAHFWTTGRGTRDNDLTASGRIMKLAYWLAHKERYTPEDFACLVRIWKFSQGAKGLDENASFRSIARAWSKAVHSAQWASWSPYSSAPPMGPPDLKPFIEPPREGKQNMTLRPPGWTPEDDTDEDTDPAVNTFFFGPSEKRSTTPARSEDARPIVRIENDTMSRAVAETCAHLAAANLGLYDRGHILVHVLQDTWPTAIPDVSTTFFSTGRVSQHAIWYSMAKAARFQAFDGRMNRWKYVKPPEKLASAIIDSPNDWAFPKLDGIQSCQTMRTNGSLVTEEGYDASMRTLFRNLPVMQPLPEEITYQHAQTALALLADLLKEFPFVDLAPDGSTAAGPSSASFSGAVAAFITAVLRPMLGTAPLFALSSSEPGSGKSYLWDCLSAVVTGDACPVVAASTSPEETDKQLTGAMLASRPIISFDNINGNFGSPLICQANSQPRVDVRALGSSDIKTIGNASLMLCTGNNLRIRDDLVRRTVMITLDAGMENPERRIFAQKPLQMILNDRGTYIRACLIIACWYTGIGLMDRQDPIGGYEYWSDYVRSPLIALGLTDPWLTQAAAQDSDPAREIRRETLANLHRVFGDTPTTVAQMLAGAETDDTLKQALTGAAAGARGILSPQSMRGWLSRNKSTRRDGYLLTGTKPQTRDRSVGMIWTVMLTQSGL
jgi:putative DNA primase/helicase